MFNKILTIFLQLCGKAAGDLEHALSVVPDLTWADSIIFNYIGENVKNQEDVYKAVANYYSVFNSMVKGGNKDISVKISQFGGNEVLLKHLITSVCIRNSVLWVDAEEYDQANKQLELALTLSSYLNPDVKSRILQPNTVGLCLQLKSDDCEIHAKECFINNILVRLCKGAYPSDKYTKGVLLSKAERIILLHKESTGNLLELATVGDFDLAMLALEHELPLQLLYGFHKKFMNYPFTKKVYLPFGKNWYPYIKRRFMEKLRSC